MILPAFQGVVTRPSSGVTDPYFANVSSLMHFDGNLTDVTGKTWAAAGSAAATGTAKFGTNALICDGDGDWISTSTHADFNFGTGDFTIELFMNPDYTGETSFIDVFTIGAYTEGILLRLSSPATGKDSLYLAGAATVFDFWSTQVPGGSYTYLALKRSGTAVTLVGGTSGSTSTLVTATSSANLVSTSGVFVGSSNLVPALACHGLIDEWRVTKGVARDISTVPTAAFPDS